MKVIVTQAPSNAAANAAETALADSLVFGLAATLGIRQGRWLAVVLAEADVPPMLTELYARGWEVVSHETEVTAAQALADGVIGVWVSGYMAGQALA